MPNLNRIAKSIQACSNPNCRALLDKTRGLKTCGGCHAVAYCDKRCQKAAWQMHKAACLGWKNGALSGSNAETVQKRFVQLTTFYQHHSKSFEIFAHAAIRCFQSTAGNTFFDPRKHFFEIHLEYQPDKNEGNPSTMFKLLNARIIPLAPFDSGPPEAFAHYFDVSYDIIKSIINPNDPAFRGQHIMPTVIHSFQVGGVAAVTPVNHDIYRDDSFAVRADPTCWLSELQRRIERGHLYETCIEADFRGMHLGKLVRVCPQERGQGESKWRFVKLMDQETRDNGYIHIADVTNSPSSAVLNAILTEDSMTCRCQ